jgi:RND family efflux transporter MFP subunit
LATEDRRAARDDLAALRIDRDAVPLRRGPNWSRWLLTATLILAFTAASIGAWRMTIGRTPSVQVAFAQRSGPGAASAGAVLTGSGYVVTGERYISLGVRVPSRIERFLVEEGQHVEKGDALVQLDARQYEAALAQARANLLRARANADLARKELARARVLIQKGVLSRADLDVRENQLRVAEADIAQLEAAITRAEVDLEDTVIRAPTSGVILEKFKEVGEIAVPGGFEGSGELIRMANLKDMRAELDVNEADLARIKLGQLAEVKPDAYTDRSYKARVVKLYPQINRQKGTLKVEVGIESPDAWLRPDMSVRIAFLEEAKPAVAGEEPSLVLAPREAVRTEDGASFAWVVTSGRVRRQPLETAGERGVQLVVSKGLAGGEALVIGGDTENLREGQRVDVPDSSPSEP